MKERIDATLSSASFACGPAVWSKGKGEGRISRVLQVRHAEGKKKPASAGGMSAVCLAQVAASSLSEAPSPLPWPQIGHLVHSPRLSSIRITLRPHIPPGTFAFPRIPHPPYTRQQLPPRHVRRGLQQEAGDRP